MKAELSIEIIFLLFVGAIVALVIVGLVTSWSFDVDRYFKNWLGTSEGPEVLDNQRINLTSCSNIDQEIIKHAKLCYTKAKQGKVSGEACYGILMPGCTLDVPAIDAELTDRDINHSISVQSPADKVFIFYDYENEKVSID